jgi:hypothetical protein
MALAFMAGESANRSYHQPAVNLCAPIEQPNRDGSITLTIHGNCWIQETPKVPDGPTILRLEKTCPVGCKPIPSPAPTLVNVPPHTTLVGRIEGCNVYYIGEGDDGTTAVICHDGSTRTSARHLTSVKPIRYRYVRANMVERR